MRKEEEPVWALGLMSGTSLDGIDAALIRTDGEMIHEFGEWLTQPFDDVFRGQLRDAVHGRGDILKVEHQLTLKHAEAVKALMQQANMTKRDIAVIGFHGQTIIHRPSESLTWQIGNGALLAEKTAIDVVADFRRRDMAAEGEGAPLVPLYHAALARQMQLPIAVLNVGGIANVTWIGRSEHASSAIMDLDIMAFDTGPGNVLLNEWALKHTGTPCDTDGKLALAGIANHSLVEKMMQDDFFAKHPPKSLDRNYFTYDFASTLSPADGSATLVELTTASVAKATEYFPIPAKQWFVSGGGRHNPAVMQSLKRRLNDAYPVESLGWIGDALEAQAFAFLAVRSLKRLPISLPTTTGARKAVTGGAHYRA